MLVCVLLINKLLQIYLPKIARIYDLTVTMGQESGSSLPRVTGLLPGDPMGLGVHFEARFLRQVVGEIHFLMVKLRADCGFKASRGGSLAAWAVLHSSVSLCM